MPRTRCCLWFDTQAEEAASFYVSVFPGSRINAVTRYGPGLQMPEGTVLTIDFELDGQPYLAVNAGPEFNFTPAISLVIVVLIGLVSAVVDNVPLVAASMGMYSLQQFPADSFLWEFLAYCAGTGGSILIIGSAAGVAAMGLEKIDFFWYVRKVSGWALLGYLAGAAVYMTQYHWLH